MRRNHLLVELFVPPTLFLGELGTRLGEEGLPAGRSKP